jgi:uncharacterized protein YcnI
MPNIHRLTRPAATIAAGAAAITLTLAAPASAHVTVNAATAGWTATTHTTKLTTPLKTDDGQATEAIATITWTATPNNAIKPGQFQEFEVSLGPLPDTDQIVFKALQTYSDGDVVRWIDEPTTTGAEPEHPAPVLNLADATTSDAAPSVTAADTQSANRRGYDIAGIALGLAALVTALLAYRRANPAG